MLVFGAPGSVANVLRALGSAVKMILGLQATERWGSGLHGKDF